MRVRLGGVAALLMCSSACAMGSPVDTSAEAIPVRAAHVSETTVADGRPDVAPTAHAAAGVQVLVVHAGGVDDAGLDAAVSTLSLRPDLAVTAVAAGPTEVRGGRTMSGFPARQVAGDLAAAVDAGLDRGVDLLVLGIVVGTPAAADVQGVVDTARDAGTAVIVVVLEPSSAPDFAAAALELLDAIDHSLDDLLAEGGAIRLTVPSCAGGTIRGRIDVATSVDTATVRSDCTVATLGTPRDESEAVAAGYVAVAEL